MGESIYHPPNWPHELGFGDPIDVRGRYSVAEQFPVSRSRTGIYLLEFDNSLFYIGQAVNVVRRFAEHQRFHNNIVFLRFQRVAKRYFDTRERDLIQAAEQLGIQLTNIVHVAAVQGNTDLDLLISPSEQQLWLENPTTAALIDVRQQLAEDDIRRMRLHNRYLKLKNNPHFHALVELVRRYVALTLPAPGRTELSFWSISCLPATHANTWPRLIVVNVYKMETLVIGFQKQQPAKIWGFINMTNKPLKAHRRSFKFRWQRRGIKFRKANYASAGHDQLQAQFESFAAAEKLMTETIQYSGQCVN